MGDTQLTIAALAGRWNRLGLASHFLAAREPFGSFGAAALIRTLAAQIDRENCLFALDGQRVVGYVGWAVYDTDVAEKLAAGGAPPPSAQSRGKDVVWVLTAAALHPDALMALLRALRAQHPGLRMMAVRHKRDGRRVVFDRAARIGPDRGAWPRRADRPVAPDCRC
jgi:hemolysin-activating ACP:hemolysin acyltransferase